MALLYTIQDTGETNVAVSNCNETSVPQNSELA
jgi:hypothetical protein